MESIIPEPGSLSEAEEVHQTPSSSSSSSSTALPNSFDGTAAWSIDNNNGSEKTKMEKQENISTRQPPLRQSNRSNRGVPSASMMNQDELLQQLAIDAASSNSSSSPSPSSSSTTNKKRVRARRGEQENESDKAKKPSTAPPRTSDDGLSIIRNRLTNGLLKAIRQQSHGPPPSGKKPYSKYEEGMNEERALQLMNGYDDYQTSDTKKCIRWLLYDQDKIAELLALPNNNIIPNVPYGGWVRVFKGQPTPSILKDAEFEALEVRYDRERNLFVLTSRTRLYYNENDAYHKWPVPKKLHFNPPQ